MYYAINKLAAKTRNSGKTETDQSQAEATDLNVIVKKFGVTGNVRALNAQPLFGQDTTEWPQDLRGVFETARKLHIKRSELPEQLRGLTMQELFSLTDRQLEERLTPVQPKDETKKEEPK